MQQTKFLFSTSEFFGEAWNIFLKRPWFFVGFTVIYILVGNISGFTDRMGETESGVGVSGGIAFFMMSMSLVSMVLSILIGAGALKTYIRVARGDMRVNFSDLFSVLDFKILLNYVLVSIIAGLLAILGLIFFIVPGIYFMLKYFFVAYIVIDKQVSFSKAMELSAVMTQGIKMQLLGFSLFSILVGILGVLALGVGLLLAVPVIFIAGSLLYVRAIKYYDEASSAHGSAEPVGIIQN